MQNLSFYLDTAKTRNGIKSDAKLAHALSVHPTSIVQWRNGRAMISEKNMLNLAKMVGVSKEQALLELSYWNADDEGKAVYQGLMKRLGVTAAALAALMVVSVPQANAAFNPVHHMTDTIPYVKDTVYYGKAKKIIKRIQACFQRLFKGFFSGFEYRFSTTYMLTLN